MGNSMSVALGLLIVAQLNSFEFTEIVSPQVAGDSFSITVVAKDESGGVYPFNGAALLSTSEDDYWGYVYPTLITFSNGVWQDRILVTLAESLSLKCLEPQSLAEGLSNRFEMISGAPDQFDIILPGEELAPGSPGGRLPGQPDSHTAGDTFDFDVYLTDAWHNVVAGRNDSVYFSATDAFARLPAPDTLSGGTATFSVSFREADTQRLVVYPAGGSQLEPDSSSEFDVIPGPFEQLLVLLPGETALPGDTTTPVWLAPGKDGDPSPQYVQTPFDVAVYGCDHCWNVVDAVPDTVRLLSDFSFSSEPTEGELGAGTVFQAAFGSAGLNQNIWAAEVNGGYSSYRSTFDVLALGKILEVTAPDTVRAGETAYVHVRLLDVNHVPIVAAPVRFAVIAGSGDMLDSALLTDTLGRGTARFLCSRARYDETDTIRVSADTSVDVDIYVQMPDESLLDGEIIAYPNPFGFNRDRVEIAYYLPRSVEVHAAIYDPFGNVVIEWRFPAGSEGGLSGLNRIYWDGRNSARRRVANGIYVLHVLAQLHTGTIFNNTHRIGVVW